LELVCGFCNGTFNEEEMYQATKRWYEKNDFGTEVKSIMISKNGNVKVPHLYICPKCGHLVNNATLSMKDGT